MVLTLSWSQAIGQENSELGLYIDHFKGDRKDAKSSRAEDIGKSSSIAKVDYWKNK